MGNSDGEGGVRLANDILIGRPTNNFGRILLFRQAHKLTDVLDVETPEDHGGLRSERYKQINPQGKFPALILSTGSFFGFESQVILDFIADKHSNRLLSPVTPDHCEKRALCRLLIQVHDIYLASPNSSQPGYTATQAWLYRDSLDIQTRNAKAREMYKQLDVIEGLLTGPCAVGDCSMADYVLFPSILWYSILCPRCMKGMDMPEWDDIFHARPRMKAWYKHLTDEIFPESEFLEILEALKSFAHSFRSPDKINAQILEEGKDMEWK